MKCRCIRRSIAELSPDDARHFGRHVHLDEVHLEIGREYLIFGVLLRDGRPWYLLCEEEDDDYLKPHFSELFELVDPRIPPDWSLALHNTNAGPFALLPTAWAADPAFLEKLVDGEPAAVAAFSRLREALDEWHRAS